jgi:hypothetical protein
LAAAAAAGLLGSPPPLSGVAASPLWGNGRSCCGAPNASLSLPSGGGVPMSTVSAGLLPPPPSVLLLGRGPRLAPLLAPRAGDLDESLPLTGNEGQMAATIAHDAASAAPPLGESAAAAAAEAS